MLMYLLFLEVGEHILDAQGLLLALNMGIILGAQGTMWGARDQTQVGQMQEKFPPQCTVALATPVSYFYFFLLRGFMINGC